MNDPIEELLQILAEKLQETPNLKSFQVISRVREELKASPHLIDSLRKDERIIQQVNIGDSRGFQTIVSGGVANIGTHYHIDSQLLSRQLGDILEELARQSKPTGVPHNLPRSGAVKFVGREQRLKDLHRQLQQDSRISITAISGMGGIGKTELALQYAIAQKKAGGYPGGICWLRARDEEIAAQIKKFAQANLGMVLPELEPEYQVAACWQRWPTGDVLVVIDDVTDYTEIEPYFPPADRRFKLLITTRLDFGRSVTQFTIDELDEESALSLLDSAVEDGRIQSQISEAQALCEWVGYLPLGLELVGRYLADEPDLSVRALLEELNEVRLDAEALQAVEVGMTAKLGVVQALELSWRELDELEQNLACLLGMFAIAPIPWHLVESCWPEVKVSVLKRVRKKGLLHRNLLKRVGENLYQMHQIVQEFFRVKLHQRAEKGVDIKESFCAALVEIAKNIDKNITLTKANAVRETIVHLEEMSIQWNHCLKDEDFSAPFIGVGRFYQGQGLYGLALPWYSDCLERTKNKFGETHQYVAVSLSHLALLYRAQGRYEQAEPLLKEALRMRQQLLGEAHPDVATSLNNLALLYRALEKYEQAEPLYKKALAMRLQLLGEAHPSVASSMNNLAGLYRTQGKHEEAEPLYKKALAMRRQLLGEAHPSVATSLNDLAGLYRIQCKYEQAESLYKSSLAMFQSLLGDTHPSVANSLDNLAALYRAQGKYEQAEPLSQSALSMRQKLLGKSHPHVASSLNTLAGLYRAQGKYDQAEPLYEEALTISKQQLGETHTYVATNTNDLAGLYCAQGKYDQAEPLYKEALAIYKLLLGELHPCVANSSKNLAELYRDQGKYEQAESLFQEVLAVYRQSLGDLHPSVADTLHNLGMLHQKQGRCLQAKSLYERALAIAQPLLGSDHPQTKSIQRSLDFF